MDYCVRKLPDQSVRAGRLSFSKQRDYIDTVVASVLRPRPTDRSKSSIVLTLNGESTEALFASHKTLLEVLREDLGLTGTKHGCELGECGTCTVLVDGKPVLSCLVLGLECEGRAVETVEGMAGAAGPASAAESLRRPRRGPVRLLHPGFPADGEGAARGAPEAHPRPDQGSAGREPLPLHRVHQDLRGRRARGGVDAGRGR